MAKPSSDYPRLFGEYFCIWGGVDLMVDPRFGFGLSLQKYL